MKKKALAMLVATTLVVTSVVGLAGCGNKDTDGDKTVSSTKFTGTKIFKSTNGKVKTLNPHTWTKAEEADMLYAITGPLTGDYLNEKKEAQQYPVFAKELPTISADKMVYTYKLREGLKFTNGTPIDADTYIYSYKQVLDPVMKNYRANSFMGDIKIKNAKNYYDGKCSWEDVGIKAIDKHTLQFTLEIAVKETQAMGVFNYAVLVDPQLYEKCLSADKKTSTYGTSLETMASCGEFELVDWKFDQAYKLKKNKDYPLANMITTDEQEIRVVEEVPVINQLFENGDIDFCTLVGTAYDKYKEDPKLYVSLQDSVSTMSVNAESKTNPILANKDLRKALFYGLDREKIAKDIVKSAAPAAYIIPRIFTFEDNKKNVSFRDLPEGKANVEKNNGFDLKLAKEYFEKAYAANGNKKITITVLYVDSSDIQKTRSEYAKKVYEEAFGADRFELKLQATPSQVISENRKNGKYEITYGGWSGGYKDNAPTRMKVYASDYPSKSDVFKNKEFDELVKRCMEGDLRFDEKGKLEATAKMEKIMLDDCTVIPIFENLGFELYSDKFQFINGKKYDPKVGFARDQAEYTR